MSGKLLQAEAHQEPELSSLDEPSSLVPTNTPLNFNLGINYESWSGGRTGYDINADLNQITQYFKLIKTFHDAAVGTINPADPIIDPTQQQVISYVVANPGLELVMGTNNNALAAGGYGTPWSAGLMTSSAYTDQWVQMIIGAFGSAEAVKAQLSMILLGNEVDANGPPPSDPAFASYQTWINQSFSNLKASLAAAGLGSIPISTTIANYGSTNAIATGTTDYIQSNWSPEWNNGSPIVLFNQYTPADGSGHEAATTNYAPVISYFNSVDQALNGKVEPFVGETGYSTYYGEPNQDLVYDQIFAWLNAQYAQGGKTVPLFAFDAFDQPANADPVQAQYGIFSQNASFAPTGLKDGITIPVWSSTPLDTIFGTATADRLVGTAGLNHFLGGGDDDTITAAGGHNKALYWAPSENYAVAIEAGSRLITVHDRVGSDGTDSLTGIQTLGFADGSLDLTSLVKAASAPADTLASIANLYSAYLDRAPDSQGLYYWAARFSEGMSMSDIARSFFASSEAAELVTSTSVEDAVTKAYLNLLHRAPDAIGFDYWVDEVDTGRLSLDQLPLALIAGAFAPSGGSDDAQYLLNRSTVGTYFAVTQGLGNLEQARLVSDVVEISRASVVKAADLVDLYAADASSPDSSDLVVQLTGLFTRPAWEGVDHV